MKQHTTSSKDLVDYRAFIAGKADNPAPSVMRPGELSPLLKHHQRVSVEFALERGRSALFFDTGLGKSFCELEWARRVAEETGRPSLILSPLAVGPQMVREGKKFGIDAVQVREADDIGSHGIVVTNYERLDKFDPSVFGGVVLDESSILKNYTGKTKRALVSAFRDTPFHLAATATPAPNDNMEIGQHAEFLGIMPGSEMLTRWFIADQATMGGYRIKGHAVEDFWSWVASWSRCASLPSDLGGDDEGYILPEIERLVHAVERDILDGVEEGCLFAMPKLNATSFHAENRKTLSQRCDKAAELADHDRPVTIWCESNDESAALKLRLPDAVEVRGSDPTDSKEAKLDAFANGDARIIITKPSIAGFGVNWQHCSHAVFASISYSYEQHYQAVRRSHRFGQTQSVRNDIILSDTAMNVWSIVNEKAEAHARMKAEMSRCMARAQTDAVLRRAYDAPPIPIPDFLRSTYDE